MSVILPAIGSRVRATRAHETGTSCVAEGILDGTYVHRGQHIRLDGHFNIDMTEDNGWTVTLEVLAPPCPPEPRRGVSGQALADAETVWLRGFGGWFDGFADERGEGAFLTWAQLYARSPKVRPLVAEPLLVELVEALRTAAGFRHEDMHIGDFATCPEQDCADDRALLAKVAGEVTA